jgi:hypothetical protein
MTEITLPREPAAPSSRDFLVGAGSAVGAAVGIGVLLWLGVIVFQGGPQTGRDHFLPGTLAILLLGLGVVQGLWLVPALIYCARTGRRAAAWGLFAGGALIFLLNAALDLFVMRNFLPALFSS